jgi:hypothetical protein
LLSNATCYRYIPEELAKEQARRAADRRAYASELETKTREGELSSRKLRQEVDLARSQLDGAQEDFKREAFVADIVNSRGKDAMSKLAADNLELRRELGRLSFRGDTAGGLRKRDGSRGDGVSDNAILDYEHIGLGDANLRVDDYLAAGALSEFEYLTAGVRIKGGGGDGDGSRPSTTGGIHSDASMAATRGGGWVVPGPSPGAAGTKTGKSVGNTAGTGNLAHSAHWRRYDPGHPVGGSSRHLMDPKEALGYTPLGVYSRSGYRPGAGEGSAGYMAAAATVEGRRLGGRGLQSSTL